MTINLDSAVKWISLILSVFAIPAFTWSWAAQEQMTVMRVKMSHQEQQLSKMENVNADIKVIKNEIQTVDKKLDKMDKRFDAVFTELNRIKSR
jgi:peptidoglycan hydrolase CwlO-like protein